jgi:hypothetical protein
VRLAVGAIDAELLLVVVARLVQIRDRKDVIDLVMGQANGR